MPTVELTIFEKLGALLNKIGSYLVDPRLVVAALSVWGVLRMLGIVQVELAEADLAANLHVIANAATAVAEVLGLVAIAWKYLDGITARPPRGIGPWADVIKAKKIKG